MPYTINQTSAIDLLKQALVDRVALKLLIEPTDSAKAGLVREGRLQADPTAKKSNILIHPGGRDYPDKLDTSGIASGAGATSPYSLGGPWGSVFWRKRVRIELLLFFSNDSNRQQSQQKADLTISRLFNAILTWDARTAVPADSFGEALWQVQILESEMTEGGGQGAFNWRGNIIVEFLTEIEPIETE